MKFSGAVSLCLACCLAAMTLFFGDRGSVSGDVMFTGSSILATEVGGYVLTAVLAFMAGVFVTAGIRFLRDRRDARGNRRQ